MCDHHNRYHHSIFFNDKMSFHLDKGKNYKRAYEKTAQQRVSRMGSHQARSTKGVTTEMFRQRSLKRDLIANKIPKPPPRNSNHSNSPDIPLYPQPQKTANKPTHDLSQKTAVIPKQEMKKSLLHHHSSLWR